MDDVTRGEGLDEVPYLPVSHGSVDPLRFLCVTRRLKCSMRFLVEGDPRVRGLFKYFIYIFSFPNFSCLFRVSHFHKTQVGLSLIPVFFCVFVLF